MKDKGYIHIYTGNGKGKTTAAVGLAIRAAGAGLRIYIGQFIKGMSYSELGILKTLDNITIEQYGRGCFIEKAPDKEDIELARQGLNKAAQLIIDSSYDVIILDEINIALYFNLFTAQEVLEALNAKRENLEIVMTGRYAPKELIEVADLVTEMREIKHYYSKGIEARLGIEK